jgi:hypothetical protein
VFGRQGRLLFFCGSCPLCGCCPSRLRLRGLCGCQQPRFSEDCTLTTHLMLLSAM